MGTNQVRIIDEFTKLVAIDSPSYGERQLGDYVKNRLQALGLLVIEDGTGDTIGGSCGNIYGFLKGDQDKKPLLFCAHMDTVEPSRGKEAVLGADGVIRSGGKTVLGADDMSGVAAILEALTVIKEKNLPHRPVEVLFTVAEEVYTKGSGAFDFAKVMAEEAYVLDLSGPVGTAAYAAPSILSFTITIHGKASHAGFAPQKGIHAISAAADAIAMLPMGRLDEETSLNIGTITGGLGTNIIPDKCVVRGEVRSLNHEKAKKQAELVRKQFELSASAIRATVDFQLETASVAYETPVDHPVVKRFESACNALQLPVSLVRTFGGSDQNVIAQQGIRGIVLANAMNRVHALDEYTTVEELLRAADLTLALMTSEE
ncbi:peptidase T-like protein [Sporobacter termitidis DSM 10068]|uniref:Peptidase T-like protein n=1 Tax=Sporobacter termitidis DSM 10068 TaxID=1123282 RepID=A0A1M5ZBK7_9FIRM|nr:M20/M25/M40 family metallo-hydrolase [Sporobacter termitidis]SHI21572.1 peptidase T-like protein [Sporobacter termitidis DSM 10068]